MTGNWSSRTWGRRNERPIVALHGFMGQASDFDELAAALPDRFIIGFDLPGHGLTQLDNECSVESWASSWAEQIRPLAPVTGLGYSLGGRILLATYFANPSLFSQLILVSTSPGIEDHTERQARFELDKRRAADLLANGIGNFLDNWLESEIFSGTPPSLKAKLKYERANSNSNALAEVIGRLSPGTTPSLWNRLSEITCPSIVVAGARDSRYCEIAKNSAIKMPFAKCKIISNAAHLVHLEQPKALADILT